MEESVCRNVNSNNNKGIEDCPSKGSSAGPVCVFSIWSRPWMKKFGKDLKITAIHCQ